MVWREPIEMTCPRCGYVTKTRVGRGAVYHCTQCHTPSVVE